MAETDIKRKSRRGLDAFGVAFALIFLSVGIVGTYLVSDLYRSHQQERENYRKVIGGLETVSELQVRAHEARRTVLCAFAVGDSVKQKEFAEKSAALATLATRSFAEVKQLADASGQARAIHELEGKWNAYFAIHEQLLSLISAGDIKAATDRNLAEGIPVFMALADELQSLKGVFRADVDQLVAAMEQSFLRSVTRLIVILGLTLALATVAVKAIQKNSVVRALTASEAQLRQSHHKFETLVNSINGIVWEADPRTFRFNFVSQPAEGLLGFPLSDWLNIPRFWLQYLHPDDLQLAVRTRREATVQKKPYRVEYRMITMKGKAVWIQESATVIVERGMPVLLRGVLLNISDQKNLHQQLLDVSRQAGMAEVATGVLHNVGNVLNSVNVAAQLVHDRLQHSKIGSLIRAVNLMKTQPDLKEYLFEDPKGKLMPQYLIDVSGHLEKEREKLLQEMTHLLNNLAHVKDVVSMQQGYAKVVGLIETLPVPGLIEDALQINATSFHRDGIEIVRDFRDVPPVAVDKHKVMQILVNLAKNAKQALDASKRTDKQLTLSVSQNGNNRVKIIFRDNGIGIPPENLTRIFSHGFTTKPNGHGFGLHSAALAAKEMGGSLAAQSEGVGRGATFVLELPIAPKQN